MKAKEIIDNINGNDGLDMNFIRWNARQEHKTERQYLYEWVKASFPCHGNTARTVVKYYI